MSRAANYEDQRRRAAEFVNKAVNTALMDGPPSNLEPPPVGNGWQGRPYDGQSAFIQQAIEQFKKHAPNTSLDIPAADFSTQPPAKVYADAVKLSKWNKSSASVQPDVAMFKVRHAFWRFIASAILHRKILIIWPTMNWPMIDPNEAVQINKFLATVHSWADLYLRSAGVIR